MTPNLPIGTENDKSAPWNQEDDPICCGRVMEFEGCNKFGNIYRCSICEKVKDNEPNEE